MEAKAIQVEVEEIGVEVEDVEVELEEVGVEVERRGLQPHEERLRVATAHSLLCCAFGEQLSCVRGRRRRRGRGRRRRKTKSFPILYIQTPDRPPTRLLCYKI